MLMNRECPDQTLLVRMLIWVFAGRIWHKGLFTLLRVIYDQGLGIPHKLADPIDIQTRPISEYIDV